MGKSKNNINKEGIMNDINKYLQTLCISLTNMAADQYTADAKASIEEYYLDYSPRFYDRTFDLLKNSYYRYYKKKNKNYFGGVMVSSEKMKDYINSGLLSNNEAITPKQDVFNWTWIEGYHGYNWTKDMNYNRNITPIQTDPPISKLLERFNDKAKYNNIVKEALSEARNENYDFLKFSNEG